MIYFKEDSITGARETETQLKEKDEQLRLALAQIQAQSAQADFLEDCIAEMAVQVYEG